MKKSTRFALFLTLVLMLLVAPQVMAMEMIVENNGVVRFYDNRILGDEDEDRSGDDKSESKEREEEDEDRDDKSEERRTQVKTEIKTISPYQRKSKAETPDKLKLLKPMV